MVCSCAVIDQVRGASRAMVRELGFMGTTLAASQYPPSTVHTLVEIGRADGLTGAELVQLLGLEKSSVSRLVAKLVTAGELEELPHPQDARSKTLHLTAKGRQTLAGIDRFASQQVRSALACLTPEQQRSVVEGLGHYAEALHAARLGSPVVVPVALRIEPGYRPGIIGRMAEMHASYYAREAGFGQVFESRVASDMAELLGRLHNPRNQVWAVLAGERIVGSLAIDGEGEHGAAILRAFILDDAARGRGAGRQMLAQALAFCDQWAFPAIRLWTFKGLDAARRLYEDSGFQLEREEAGEQWGTRVIEQCFVRRLPAASST